MTTEKGYISHFTFRSDDGSFAVFELEKADDTIVCVGNVGNAAEGESVECEGEYINHPIYNRQFKLKSIRTVEPEDEISTIRYLGSGAIKGIGEALAKRIVAAFGAETFRIAQEEPERLAEVKGISLKKAYDIGNQIASKRDMRDAMMFMQKLGISQNLGNKIYKKYGADIYDVLRENPYRLADEVEGVGFKIADEIAVKSGIRVNSEYRIRCAFSYILMQAAGSGHCYFPKERLYYRCCELLGIDMVYHPEDMSYEPSADTVTLFDMQLDELSINRRIVVKEHDGEVRIYAASYYYVENECAGKLLELRDAYSERFMNKSPEAVRERVGEISDSLGYTLDELQQQAVCRCIMNNVFILTGGPGTGKTTTINTLIHYFEAEKVDFYLAAPTGRAAKRIQETTGYEAKTIHRLLEINGNPEEEHRGMVFERNSENPLEADVIIIDEMSMVDIHLFRALLDAVAPGTKLVMVGDVDQLSSVGPGQVLKDILESEAFAYVILNRIYRQDEESHIVSYAHKINNGEKIDFCKKYVDFFLLEKDSPEIILNYIERLVTRDIPKQFGIDVLDTQILTPMRKGALGVEELNRKLRDVLNPAVGRKKEYLYGQTLFREGDKVMQIKNNYEMEWEITGKYDIPIDSGKGVFNGDSGRIIEINEFAHFVKVQFDDGRKCNYPFESLEELEHAYAMTIHKSQGSEYPVIILPLLTGPKMLMTRNLLYTAVTRARECVIILGKADVVNEMIDTDMVQKRYTSLKERINEYSQGDIVSQTMSRM